MALTDGILASYNFQDDYADIFGSGPTLVSQIGTLRFNGGHIGNSVGFNGFQGSEALSHLRVTDELFDFEGNDRTIAGWFWAENYSGAPGIISNWASDSGVVQYLFWYDGAHLVFQMKDAGGGDHVATFLGTAPTMEWTYFCLRFNSVTGDLTLNINDETAVTATTPSVASGTTVFEIGGRNGALASLNGGADGVTMWGRVLSDDEVLEYWNDGAGMEFTPIQRSIYPGGYGEVFDGLELIAPPDIQVGNVLLASIFVLAGVELTITPPDGWALLVEELSTSDADFRTLLYWKRAEEDDTTAESWTWTWSGGIHAQGIVTGYEGMAPIGNPFIDFVSDTRDNSASAVTPALSLTTGQDNVLLIYVAANFTGGNWTPPAGFNERYDSGGGGLLTIADRIQIEGGATGSLTASDDGGNGPMQAFLLVMGSGALSPPVADFSADPLTGDGPLEVEFTDESVNGPTSWDWDFGDGSSHSTEQNPTHVYDDPGTYTVILTVANGAGEDEETKVDYIEVTAAPAIPVADFSADVVSGDVPLAVHFTDESTNSPTSWAWDFGDGSTSTEQNPDHTYGLPGTYTVSLVATNDDGSDTETKTGYIAVGANTYPWLLTLVGVPESPTGVLQMIVDASDSVFARGIANSYSPRDPSWNNAIAERLLPGFADDWAGWSFAVTVGGSGAGQPNYKHAAVTGTPGEDLDDVLTRLATALSAGGLLVASYAPSTLTVDDGSSDVGDRAVLIRVVPPNSESDFGQTLINSITHKGAEDDPLEIVFDPPTVIPVLIRSY